MHQPDYSAVRAYMQAWTTEDPLEVETLIQSCWTEQGEVVGPGYRFKGSKAVIDEIQRFRTDQPGWKAVTSGLDGHGRWVRFEFTLLDPTGLTSRTGWDVIELDEKNRIARVVTFWGLLPQPSAEEFVQTAPSHK